MPSLRSLLGVGRRALSARLDQLHETLENLGEKLRESVAQALGQTVGVTVRETLLGALNDRVSSTTNSSYPPFSSRDDDYRWQTSERDWRDEDRDRYAEEDREYREPWGDEQPTETADQPVRLPLAVSTGLRAAAWCLRRWWGKVSVVGAVAVGLVAACTTYLAGPVADAGLSLIESADQLTSLRRAVQSTHDRMSW